jgi:hypothetical protein
MPFTISHAAAVLPLQKLAGSRLPLAAMMIGSMSPDFAYFIPGGFVRDSSHDLAGLLFFCLPLGLALWLLFVRVVERPTIDLLPAQWRARVPRSDPTLSIKALVFASIAIIVGAMTHIAWDSFTHANTAMTDAFPLLGAEIFTFRGRAVRVFLIMQVLSSVIGLLALAIWARNLRRSAPRIGESQASRSFLSDRARVGAALVVLVTSGATALLAYANYSHSPLDRRLFHLLIGGMTGWALAWCAVAVFVTLWTRLATRTADMSGR